MRVELLGITKSYAVIDDNDKEYIVTVMWEENTQSESYEVVDEFGDSVPKKLAYKLYEATKETNK